MRAEEKVTIKIRTTIGEIQRNAEEHNLLLMELDDGVVVDVAHVKHATFSQHFRMLIHHKPADVSKEEASIRIVGIGIGFGEFVVHTMVANPFVDRILTGQCKAQHQNHTQRSLCFVRPMCPKTMGAAGNAKSANTAHQKTCGNRIEMK